MHPCARCATLQRTCCQRAEVFVTEGDVRRIALHSGVDDIVVYRTPAHPDYVAPDPDDPNWVRWTVRADGLRRVLRRHTGGDCIFLGAAGCTLPGDVRPLICRLYPFEYNESGLTGIGDHWCPTVRVAPPGQTMVDALGMSREAAEPVRRQLYEELRSEAKVP